MLAMVRITASTAVFNTLIGISKMTATVIAQGIQRAITKQTIKIF
jgi:hypothetical protein